MSKEGQAIDLTHVGADPLDDIDTMQYPLDAHEPPVDSMPPATKAEAEELAALAEAEEVRRLAEEAEKKKEEETPEEEEETPEEEEEAPEEEEEAPEEEADDKRIPHSRFEEVNTKRKDAEARIKQLEAELEASKKAPEAEEEPAPEYDFDAQEKAYMDAVLDGEQDKALEIRREIRKAEQAEIDFRAQKVAKTTTSESTQERLFQEATSALEAEFPMLDDSSEEFDQELVNEIIDLYTGYVNSGKHNAIAAIDKATRQMLAIKGITKAAPAKAKAKGPSATEAKKKVAAAKKQPPKLGKNGNAPDDGEVAPVQQMSDEEYDALPESTKRRLRGDFM